MAARRVLAVTAATGRAGYVFFVDGQLANWQLSVKAAQSPNQLAAWLQQAITELRPDVVVTEKVTKRCRKGPYTRRLIKTMAELASHNYVLDVAVERPHRYRTKYEEAAVLIRRYPELNGWLPQRRHFYDKEPRSTVLFAALSIAEVVIERQTEILAESMG